MCVCVCVCVCVAFFLKRILLLPLIVNRKEDHKGSHCIIQLPHFSFFIVVVFLILKRICLKTSVVRSSVNIKKSRISGNHFEMQNDSHSNLCCLSESLDNLRWYQNTNAV